MIKETERKTLLELPNAKVSWYQPAVSKEYPGLRRYAAGDKVQAYSVRPGEDGLVKEKVEGVQVLLGATNLVAGALALGTLALTL